MEFGGGHRQTLAIVEVRHVHPERSVFLDVDQRGFDLLRKLLCPFGTRISIRRQAHEFVFAGVDAEAKEVGKGGVQEPERMRKTQFLQDRDILALAMADGRGRPVGPETIDWMAAEVTTICLEASEMTGCEAGGATTCS